MLNATAASLPHLSNRKNNKMSPQEAEKKIAELERKLKDKIQESLMWFTRATILEANLQNQVSKNIDLQLQMEMSKK